MKSLDSQIELADAPTQQRADVRTRPNSCADTSARHCTPEAKACDLSRQGQEISRTNCTKPFVPSGTQYLLLFIMIMDNMVPEHFVPNGTKPVGGICYKYSAATRPVLSSRGAAIFASRSFIFTLSCLGTQLSTELMKSLDSQIELADAPTQQRADVRTRPNSCVDMSVRHRTL